jgi:kumamolisin
MHRALRALTGLVVAALLPLVLSSPTQAAVVDGVDWGDLDPSGLEPMGGTPEADTPMVFLLGLRGQQDRAALVRSLSDPRSGSYGEYQDLPTLVQQVAASTATVEVVQAFFAGEGLGVTIDPTRTYAQVVMSLADAERIFATSWAPHAYPDSSLFDGIVMLYPTGQPVLPAPLSGLVDRVHGSVLVSTQFSSMSSTEMAEAPRVAGAASASSVPQAGGSPWRTGTPTGCPEALAQTLDGHPFGLSPSQLLDAYGIDELHAAGLDGAGMRVAIVENQRYEPANLATYRSCFGLSDAFDVVPHERGSLAPADDAASPEAILDLAVMSFAAPALDRVDLFMVGDDPALAAADPTAVVSFMQMFAAPIDSAVAGAPAPHVVSASYGECETAPLTLGGATALTGIFDQVFALAAAAGISYVVSTGDAGSSACNQLAKVLGTEFPGLAVQYPASSPYVTAVGGTNLALDQGNEIVSSGVWNDTAYVPASALEADPSLRAGGTGGTSTLTPRPWFQDVVSESPYRTVPDVSMFADELPGYLLYTDGWTSVGGTSAAAPLFAGVVALLDQRASATGQPALGFVAPLMYELGAAGSSALYDITIGDNIIFPEPEYGLTCCAAAPGYDLATGWGSPLADRLLLELERPTIDLAARQVTPGGSVVELAAGMVTGAGTPLEYEWDLDGDGTIDRTTSTPTLTVDYGDPSAAGSDSGGTGPTVLGNSVDRTVTPVVVVRTSLGRTSLGAAELTLVAAPSRLAFVG